MYVDIIPEPMHPFDLEEMVQLALGRWSVLTEVWMSGEANVETSAIQHPINTIPITQTWKA